MSKAKAQIGNWPQKTLLHNGMLVCAVSCVCVGVCAWADVWDEGAWAKKLFSEVTRPLFFHFKRQCPKEAILLYVRVFTLSLVWVDSLTFSHTPSLSFAQEHTGSTGRVYSVCLKESDSYRPCVEKAKTSGKAIKTHTPNESWTWVKRGDSVDKKQIMVLTARLKHWVDSHSTSLQIS